MVYKLFQQTDSIATSLINTYCAIYNNDIQTIKGANSIESSFRIIRENKVPFSALVIFHENRTGNKDREIIDLNSKLAPSIFAFNNKQLLETNVIKKKFKLAKQ